MKLKNINFTIEAEDQVAALIVRNINSSRKIMFWLVVYCHSNNTAVGLF